MPSTCSPRLPAVYINHGGGPLPLLGEQPAVASSLSSYARTLPSTPKAVLVVTAHWQTDATAVSDAPSPPLLFDYSGFPAQTYTYTYPAPGSPALARRACELLRAAGLPCSADSRRGWDHGVFVPMMLLFPAADVPVVQMSLTSNQDAATHLAVGAALAPLREEGVLIVGSGASFHNFKYFFARDEKTREVGVAHSRAFDEWLTATMTDPSLSADERRSRLAKWREAPSAAECHPLGAAEHFLPALVVAGAGGDVPATKLPRVDAPQSKVDHGLQISQFEFR
ncbi:hypothetical protein AB1Y20_021843 [Prymnesium parvum]|uniref:Extradiol ring-cleavage dioxygenase class III enzyme subunit B domain-containing protein n=1 Tax=Prymnesium parvum TaxID=97485 RepID=A0AB34JMK3_PRYPA